MSQGYSIRSCSRMERFYCVASRKRTGTEEPPAHGGWRLNTVFAAARTAKRHPSRRHTPGTRRLRCVLRMYLQLFLGLFTDTWAGAHLMAMPCCGSLRAEHLQHGRRVLPQADGGFKNALSCLRVFCFQVIASIQTMPSFPLLQLRPQTATPTPQLSAPYSTYDDKRERPSAAGSARKASPAPFWTQVGLERTRVPGRRPPRDRAWC